MMKQETYDQLEDMFVSDAWKLFVDSVEGTLKHLKDTAGDECVSNDLWQFRRGMLAQLASTVNFENFIKVSFEQQELSKNDLVTEESEDPNVDLI